jgi:hypothetical protein
MAATLALPVAATADCGTTPVFTCQIGARTLELCHWKSVLSYIYGPPGKPELTLAEPMETVDFTPWPGIGSAIWENVTFRNKGYTYEVWTSIQRDPEDTSGRSGGVTVMKGDETITALQCDPGTASQSLDMLYEIKQSIGQCWDFDAKAWSSTCH